MKIALYFGSFNPIHLGHLLIAQSLLDFTDCDKVWLVVSPHNPHKSKSALLGEYDRLHLCRLAVGDDANIIPSAIEFSLPQPSYTVDTLTLLTAKYPETQFCLCMGADNLASLPKWKNIDAILKYYPIYVYPRPGYELADGLLSSSVSVFDAPQFDISSTQIRERIRKGLSIRYYAPEPVRIYIEENGLYKV